MNLNKKEFVYNSKTYPNDGLIYYFFSEQKYLYNSILVDATSIADSNKLAKYSIDFTDKYWHGGKGTTTANITFHIPIPIKLKGYTIQTSDLSPSSDHCHPKQWIFSVSKDGFTKQYPQLYDDSKNSNRMNNAKAHIYIEYEHPGVYQFFHIEAISSYCNQAKNFDFNEFDVYGTITTDLNDSNTCQHNILSLNLFLFLYTTVFL